LATNWGFTGTLDNFCAAAKKEGYNGIEVWVPGTQQEMSELKHTVDKYDLKLGLLTGGSDRLPSKHKIQFTEAIERAISLNPLYINCHSGKDYFEFEENLSILQASIDLSRKSGVPLYHETHRGRSLFAAPVTKKFIDKLPDLKLTLDISHWCNVHESLLQDQPQNITEALKRTEHIHARIGHAEGPQVNDPRAPEWQEAFNAHLKWWDEVVLRKTNEGKPVTILTEFGPPNYLPTLPYTQQPVADQWAINAYMMRFLRNRYSK
jgi:sugar phosphate isomerase/epimerase